MKPIDEIVKETAIKIKKIPLDIKLFFLFAVIITLASWYLRLDSNKALKELTIPYTSWIPDSGYNFFTFYIPLFYLVIPINKETKRINLITRGTIILMMITLLILGIIEWLLVTPEDYTSTNPYLRYDELTPIYTIALPLFWILIMAGLQLIGYFNNKKKKIQDC